MKILAGFVLLLFAPALVQADSWQLFTQVSIQKELGVIQINRCLTHDDEAIEWMWNHRKELLEQNIIVDAQFKTDFKHRIEVEMRGQNIEIQIISDHQREHGAGLANADNYIEIKIDGVTLVDCKLSNLDFHNTYKVVICPSTHMISADTMAFRDDECGYVQITEHSYFFYDELIKRHKMEEIPPQSNILVLNDIEQSTNKER
ncbi:MAG: hypothetical protein H8E86_08925 [Planctomycetes bacterium]|nr:hypothetical protein [Planctomycetota bacterium]